MSIEEESDQLQKKLDYYLSSLEEDFDNIILLVKRSYKDEDGLDNNQIFRAQRGDIMVSASLIRGLDEYYKDHLTGLMYSKEDYDEED